MATVVLDAPKTNNHTNGTLYEWPSQGAWRYEDYVRLTKIQNDQVRYEIIEGVLYKMPAPTPQHQEIVGNVYFHLRQFVNKRKLGRVLFAPLDVMLNEDDTVQPDVLFVATDSQSIIDAKKVDGVPDLIVEVMSSNRRRDEQTKFNLYALYGVKEYWIVDPLNRKVTIHKLEGDLYLPFGRFGQDAIVRSNLLSGLALPVADIFD